MANLTLSPSLITLLEAKKSVARTANGQNDTDQQEAAGEAIRDTITHLNNIRDWFWLQNVTTLSNVTTANVTAPSRMKKVYSVITNTRPLTYINRRDRNRQLPNTQTVGGVYYYDVYNTDVTGNIVLTDPPTVAAPVTTLTLSYLAVMDYPANNTAAFSTIPEKAMAHVLASARTLYLADRGGPPERLSFWDKRASETLAALVIENARQLDENANFIPDALVASPNTNIAEWTDF